MCFISVKNEKILMNTFIILFVIIFVMKENTKRSIKEGIANASRGILLGFLNGFPFMRSDLLCSLVRRRDEGFDNYISKKLIYTLFFSIGLALFFFIPFDWLNSDFHSSIYLSLLFFSLSFLVFSIIHLISDKKIKDRRHIISCSTIFASTLLVCLLFGFLLKPEYKIEKDTFVYALIIPLAILAFISEITDQSITTLLIFFSAFYPISRCLNTTLYAGFKGLLTVIGVIFVALFIAKNVKLYLKSTLDKTKIEGQAASIAICLACIIIVIFNRLDCFKTPLFVESESMTNLSQLFTILTSVFASIFIPVALNIQTFKRFNREEMQDEIR